MKVVTDGKKKIFQCGKGKDSPGKIAQAAKAAKKNKKSSEVKKDG